METKEKLAEVLNDLLEINNDRIKGYNKAADEAKDSDLDLKAIFKNMANESVKYASELTQLVQRLGVNPSADTTVKGKIYRVWMDVKATFTGHDRQSVLESCEFGEDAAQRAYTDALASDAEISAEIRKVITDQQAALQKSHNLIKKYSDMHKAVNA